MFVCMVVHVEGLVVRPRVCMHGGVVFHMVQRSLSGHHSSRRV